MLGGVVQLSAGADYCGCADEEVIGYFVVRPAMVEAPEDGNVTFHLQNAGSRFAPVTPPFEGLVACRL